MAVLGSLIIGITYPIKKKDEKNDEVENNEDLVESLRKLILGRFEDKDYEFFKWSRTMHEQVASVIENFFFNCCYLGHGKYSNESSNKNDGIHRSNCSRE